MAGPSEYIFQMQGVSRLHPPDKQVLQDINLSFYPGAKIGVLGYNGAGKSTLLRIMAGHDEDYRGEAQLHPNATVGMLEQEPAARPRQGRARATSRTASASSATWSTASTSSPPTTRTRPRTSSRACRSEIDAADAWNLDQILDTAMDALRLPPADADVSTLSGGERRRVALCRLLLSAPDLLLLDEPTNHLDAESVAWLEQHLEDYKGTIVAVTHDRYFLDNVAGWILELDRGRGIPFKGNYSSWLEQKQERLGAGEAHRTRRGRRRWRPSSSGSARTRRAGARSRRRGSPATRRCSPRRQNVKLDEVQIHIPPGPRLGNVR